MEYFLELNVHQSQGSNRLRRNQFLHPLNGMHPREVDNMAMAVEQHSGLYYWTQRHSGICRKSQNKAVYIVALSMHRLSQVKQYLRLDLSFKLFLNSVFFYLFESDSCFRVLQFRNDDGAACSFSLYLLCERDPNPSPHSSVDSVGSPILRVKHMFVCFFIF